jgi:transcriptional regulator with XRE-family HTH domain
MRIRLREIREARYLTQAELAERAGLAKLSIGRIERGHARPRLWTIRRLAETLDVEPGELAIRDEPGGA